MSLDHAILGFLYYEPMSGYDLKAAFDASVKHFWPAEQSQIYRTLSRLNEQGFTEIEVIRQEDRPDRKVYHLTEAGFSELHRWLTEDRELKSERHAGLVQLFFAGGLDDEDILTMLRRFAEHRREALERLRKLPETEESKQHTQDAPAKDSYFWWLTHEYGIRMGEASLAWLEDVIARIERGEHKEARL